MATYDYDLIVIGSGPAGQRAAIQAAKLGKSVAILERLPMLGGVDVNTGTASKTMREAVLHLTGFRHRNIHGDSYSVKQNITMSDLDGANRVRHAAAGGYAARPLPQQPGGDNLRGRFLR